MAEYSVPTDDALYGDDPSPCPSASCDCPGCRAEQAEAEAKEAELHKYFVEGYDQCFREVIQEMESIPGTKELISALIRKFKSSAEAYAKYKKGK